MADGGSSSRGDGQGRIAHAILCHGVGSGIGRERFWELAGVSKTQGTKNLNTLKKHRIVQSDGDLSFGPALGMVLGISVGSESLRAVLVDANGEVRVDREAAPRVGRLQSEPSKLLDEIAETARYVLEKALEDDDLVLMVGPQGQRHQRAVPLVGVAVGWPVPVHRYTKMPGGHAMTVHWRANGESLTQQVANRLDLPPERSYALSAANAVAFWLAFDESRAAQLERSRTSAVSSSAHERNVEALSSYVAVAVRLGGNVSAGTVTIEPPRPRDGRLGAALVSGFCESVVTEGTSGFAGEIGHVAVSKELVRRLNKEAPRELAKLNSEWRCGCGQTMHLEALAGAGALAARIGSTETFSLPGRRRSGGRDSILTDVNEVINHPLAGKALIAVGRLVGHALASPILMLDPRTIAVAGPLAYPEVKQGIEQELSLLGLDLPTQPQIRLLPASNDQYLVPRGAALSVLRDHVYRELDTLTTDPGARERLVVPVTADKLPQVG